MSSQYTGNPTAVEAPSSAPGPGVAPILTLPADTDGATWANVYQAFKVLADFVAYVFVTFFGAIGFNKPSTSSDAAQLYLKDASGNVRTVFDHNGYRMGRTNEWRQEWYTITDGKMTVAPDSVINGDVTYPSPIAKKNGGTTNLTAYAARSNMLAHFGFTGISFVIETEIAVSTLTATNTWIFIGLSGDAGVVSATNNIGFMYQLSGNFCAYVTAGGVTSVNMSAIGGIAPTVGTVPTQRLRLEVHGSASPYGSGGNGKVRFFIADVLRGEFSVALPTAAMGFWAGTQITGGASSGATDVYIGSTLAAWNRQLSIPAL